MSLIAFILEMCNRTIGHVSFASFRPGRYNGSVSFLTLPHSHSRPSTRHSKFRPRAHAGVTSHNFQPRYSILPAMHMRHGHCWSRKTLSAQAHKTTVITTGEGVSCPEPP